MTMRRALLALGVVAALAFSACTTGTTTKSTAEPKAVFPSSQPTVATGQGAVVRVVHNVLPAVVNVVAESSEGQGEGTGLRRALGRHHRDELPRGRGGIEGHRAQLGR
jgi:hypothetical protein